MITSPGVGFLKQTVTLHICRNNGAFWCRAIVCFHPGNQLNSSGGKSGNKQNKRNVKEIYSILFLSTPILYCGTFGGQIEEATGVLSLIKGVPPLNPSTTVVWRPSLKQTRSLASLHCSTELHSWRGEGQDLCYLMMQKVFWNKYKDGYFVKQAHYFN